MGASFSTQAEDSVKDEATIPASSSPKAASPVDDPVKAATFEPLETSPLPPSGTGPSYSEDAVSPDLPPIFSPSFPGVDLRNATLEAFPGRIILPGTVDPIELPHDIVSPSLSSESSPEITIPSPKSKSPVVAPQEHEVPTAPLNLNPILEDPILNAPPPTDIESATNEGLTPILSTSHDSPDTRTIREDPSLVGFDTAAGSDIATYTPIPPSTAEMGVQTTPSSSPTRNTGGAMAASPIRTRATLVFSSPTSVNRTSSSTATPISPVHENLHQILQEIDAFQRSVASNSSLQERVDALSEQEREAVTQFLDLLSFPFEELATTRAIELSSCFSTVQHIANQLFNPDQTQCLLNFIQDLPNHLALTQYYQEEIQAKKAYIASIREISSSLASASSRSQTFLEAEAALNAQEASLEAQLAEVRTKKAQLLLQQGQLNEEMKTLLSKIENGPTKIQAAQHDLAQAQAKLRGILSLWSNLVLHFPRG